MTPIILIVGFGAAVILTYAGRRTKKQIFVTLALIVGTLVFGFAALAVLLGIF
jgi:hypothetical protein